MARTRWINLALVVMISIMFGQSVAGSWDILEPHLGQMAGLIGQAACLGGLLAVTISDYWS
jgi:hypothetical protein